MKPAIDQHTRNAFLKPGEVIISADPFIVSTVLGSCVAVTMYSIQERCGAICHAMLPRNPYHNNNLLYVDTAVRFIFRKIKECGTKQNIVVKLFGGAHILDNGTTVGNRKMIGELNILEARKILAELGLTATKFDVGGTEGRKLLFSIKTGDVYVRKIKMPEWDIGRGLEL